jgi:hypothetical protein
MNVLDERRERLHGTGRVARTRRWSSVPHETSIPSARIAVLCRFPAATWMNVPSGVSLT